MGRCEEARGVLLPPNWPRRVKSALLHVIALAQYAAAYTRGWAANSRLARLRLKAENDQLRREVALLAEEIRIKDGRSRGRHRPQAFVARSNRDMSSRIAPSAEPHALDLGL